HSPGWVVISVPDYRALRVRAFPAEREPEPPPVDATLSRVDYDLRVDSDVASGHATLTVDVLKNGWVRVPIPSGLFVREATLYGGLLSETHELKTGGKWTAYGKGAEPIVFAWRRKTEEHHSTLPLRMHGTLTQFVGLGEDSTSLNANVTLDVTQGAAKEAHIQ